MTESLLVSEPKFEVASAVTTDLQQTQQPCVAADQDTQASGQQQPESLALSNPQATVETDTVLQDVAAFNRVNEFSLKRGQLWLSPQEADYINALLKASNLSSSWAIEELPSTVRPFPPPQQSGGRFGRKGSSKTGSKKNKRKAAGSSSGGASNKRKSPGQPAQKDRLIQSNQSRQINKEAAAQRAQKAFTRHFKSLPDWARRLHRIVLNLSHSECAKPFAREPQPTDHDYAAIYDAIQPRLDPIGLTTIIGKLEQGSYATPLEVFNDVYSVWLAAYRTHAPGSVLWLQAHEASKLFLQQISNEPLRDDFTPPGLSTMLSSGSMADDADVGFLNRQSSSASARTKRSSTNVEKLFREFLEQHEGGMITRAADVPNHSTAPVATPSKAKKPRGGSPRKPRSTGVAQGRRQPKAKQPAAPPITDQEREAFQNYLSFLEPHHHLMLYEAFRRTAVWRSVESGEVELDDALTTPPVFRKMVSWCKAQVAVQQQQAATKRPKRTPPPEQTTTASPSIGSMAPGVGGATAAAASGGKLTATSYLESRLRPASPKYSSSGSLSSSSSSSTSSSSDDEPSSIDDALAKLPPFKL